MRKFQESVKALEADIEHANALASEFLRDYDGSVIQMRMAYSAVAHFLVQWTDCRLAGALGLLKIMIYKVYTPDGVATPSNWEREASIREFYGVIFPSLLQLPSGITELDDKKQRRLCMDKFRRMDGDFSEVDLERELECGICLELNAKTVLPDCAHSLCFRCFEDWNAKSKSCPFCRACLEKDEPPSSIFGAPVAGELRFLTPKLSSPSRSISPASNFSPKFPNFKILSSGHQPKCGLLVIARSFPLPCELSLPPDLSRRPPISLRMSLISNF